MRKLISIVLAAITVLSALAIPTAANAAKTKTYKSGVWKYTISGNHAKIVKYTGKGGKVVVPSQLGGKTVTGIAKKSFRNKWKLTSVTIPGTVRAIGNHAFCTCIALKSVKLSNGLRSIGEYAFDYCASLKSIKLPNTVIKLGKGAFYGSNLKKIKLSENITEIPEDCFGYTLFRSFTTNAKCKKLGKHAFFQTGLKSFTAGKGLKEIDPLAFKANDTLAEFKVVKGCKYFSVKGGVLYNKKKTKLFFFPWAKKCYEFTVPSTVKTIGERAFVHKYDALSISPKKINLPEGLKKIEAEAFRGNRDLKHVNIPSTVEYIGASAFDETFIKEINIPKSTKYIGDYAFCFTRAAELNIDPNPELVLGKCVFCANYKFKKLTYFPVKKSGGGTFTSCGQLRELEIPENVTRIFEEDFLACASLNSVYVPETVTRIDNQALGFHFDPSTDDNPDIIPRDDFILSGAKGSAAEQYAIANGFAFEEK